MFVSGLCTLDIKQRRLRVRQRSAVSVPWAHLSEWTLCAASGHSPNFCRDGLYGSWRGSTLTIEHICDGEYVCVESVRTALSIRVMAVYRCQKGVCETKNKRSRAHLSHSFSWGSMKATKCLVTMLALVPVAASAHGMTYRESRQLAIAAFQGHTASLIRLKAAAKSEDPYAEAALGWIYEKERHYSMAVVLERKAVRQKNPYAMAALASLYYAGHGLKRDYSKAIFWARKAADQQVPAGYYLLGFAYAFGRGAPRDKANAITLLRLAIKSANRDGDSTGANAARLVLGELYFGGVGGSSSYDTAIALFRQASEPKGAFVHDADRVAGAADFMLARGYVEGRGVRKDPAQALVWLRKSANMGNSLGETAFGVDYALGRGVHRDDVKAAYWYRLAAEQGYWGAEENLAGAYDNGHGVPRDYAKAAYWYKRAAAQGDAHAQESLGFAYFLGRGVPKDYVESAYWFKTAAVQGDAHAQFDLGLAYFYGRGVRKDYARAVYWYEKAAAQGAARAQQTLGFAYSYGHGVPKDYAKAAYWYKKAALQGNAYAQFDLGLAYFYGRGIRKDYSKAAYWFKKAAAQGDTAAQTELRIVLARAKGMGNPTEAH